MVPISGESKRTYTNETNNTNLNTVKHTAHLDHEKSLSAPAVKLQNKYNQFINESEVDSEEDISFEITFVSKNSSYKETPKAKFSKKIKNIPTYLGLISKEYDFGHENTGLSMEQSKLSKNQRRRRKR